MLYTSPVGTCFRLQPATFNSDQRLYTCVCVCMGTFYFFMIDSFSVVSLSLTCQIFQTRHEYIITSDSMCASRKHFYVCRYSSLNKKTMVGCLRSNIFNGLYGYLVVFSFYPSLRETRLSKFQVFCVPSKT